MRWTRQRQDTAKPRAHCAARTKSYAELGSRHCEERSDEAIHSFIARLDGLLRFARNDGTGCANARPMTGSAKQFIFLFVAAMDCFVAELIIGPAEGRTRSLLAMTFPNRTSSSKTELNRLARIRHRCRQAAIDRDRLSVDIGRIVAGEEQSHRRQFMRLAGALQGIELADLAVGAALLGIVEDRFCHPGLDQAWAHCVDPHPGARQRI